MVASDDMLESFCFAGGSSLAQHMPVKVNTFLDLINPIVTLVFKFQLLPWTEEF
jgi:hypothetical protein